MSFTKTAIA